MTEAFHFCPFRCPLASVEIHQWNDLLPRGWSRVASTTIETAEGEGEEGEVLWEARPVYTLGSPVGQMICVICHTLVVGVFRKISKNPPVQSVDEAKRILGEEGKMPLVRLLLFSFFPSFFFLCRLGAVSSFSCSLASTFLT